MRNFLYEEIHDKVMSYEITIYIAAEKIIMQYKGLHYPYGSCIAKLETEYLLRAKLNYVL